ncbi:MAG: spermidine synthase [Solirubrobacteraceae bacterium]
MAVVARRRRDASGRRPALRRQITRPPITVVVFVVGAASLGAEIAAARLVAPYFGASTIVWANTIAIVLVALSIGYWAGGRLATPHATPGGLSRLVLGAGVALALVPMVARPFLGASVGALASVSAGAFVGSLLAVLVLVAGPVLLLGAVAPYAVQLTVERVEDSGPVAGRLYAISTAGSLVGTFVSALVLVPAAGTHRTFLAFALALTAVGALGLPRWSLVVPLAVAGLIALPTGRVKAAAPGERVLYETETPYQYARVVQAADGSRRLELNEGLAVHSLYRPHSYLTGDYWDDFLVLPLATLGRPPRRVAMLGNAAGTVARAYGHFFPGTAVDAVDIDGALAGIGRRFFDLRGPRLRTVTADARPYLRDSAGGYDAIFVDAYRQPYIPFYLTTREFFTLARDKLRPNGVVIINVGHPEGSRSLERVLSATIGVAFPYVRRDRVGPTNTLLVGARELPRPAVMRSRAASLVPPLGGLSAAVARRLRPALTGGRVFTDDRAPVEWLIDRSIVAYAAGRERR